VSEKLYRSKKRKEKAAHAKRKRQRQGLMCFCFAVSMVIFSLVREHWHFGARDSDLVSVGWLLLARSSLPLEVGVWVASSSVYILHFMSTWTFVFSDLTFLGNEWDVLVCAKTFVNRHV
jgi:hypothetical protein